MNKRIIGIDVARALAIIGMILVNFKVALGGEGNLLLQHIVGILEGKAAATFVVLAGVGIAMMSKNRMGNRSALQKIKLKIAKRAFILFVIGLFYMPIWPADILHFYGIYMLLVLFFIKKTPRTVLTMAWVLVFIYPLCFFFFDYETGWNFKTLEYSDFWTLPGFLRNLFFNGFHPVVPWAAFMLVGLWYGKHNLQDTVLVKKMMWAGLLVFAGVQMLSLALQHFVFGTDANELQYLIGTSPMPPLPFYMVSAAALAICTISGCILLCKKNNIVITSLRNTGQLAFTFYVAHVFIGMGMVELVAGERMGQLSIEFSMGYALLFSAACIGFANSWLRYRPLGPLEWAIKKVLG